MSDRESDQNRDWHALHHLVTEALDLYGRKDAFGDGDYWLLDEDWGWAVQQVEVQNLNLLRPEVVRSLQVLLADYPGWSISVRVDVPGKEKEWPSMGLFIHSDKIVDELRREFLPADFRDFSYEL